MIQYTKSTQPTQLINVMVDLETLGIKPTSGILSIGAKVLHDSKLSYFCNTNFYSRILQESLNPLPQIPRFTVDNSTIEWWDKQDPKAREEAFSGRESIEDSLRSFSSHLSQLPGTPVLWGNAASFDLVILHHAYEVCGIPVPWDFRNEMCYRTLKNLFRDIQPPTFIGTKHTAFADACYQAAHAELILDYIEEKMK